MLAKKQVREMNKEGDLRTSGPSNQDEFSSPEFYQCPLCPGHMDENDFAWSKLLDAPICNGCTYDIHNGFVGWDERPTPEQYNHADTIERIEQLTGLTFQQLKFMHLKEKIIEWTGAASESISDTATQDMTDSKLRKLNKKLDREFLKLVEGKRGESN